jgi:hypothetical protein
MPATTWVQCDACAKWRRIPVSVAETLDDKVKWWVSVCVWRRGGGGVARRAPASAPAFFFFAFSHTHPHPHRFCKHNTDAAFASCDQPQEKSDDEIDAELAAAEEAEVRSERGRSGSRLVRRMRGICARRRPPRLRIGGAHPADGRFEACACLPRAGF